MYPGPVSSDAGILGYEAYLHNYVDAITKCGHVNNRLNPETRP